MKFIRDIIGEKRQAEPRVNGTPAPESLVEERPAAAPETAAAPEGALARGDLDMIESMSDFAPEREAARSETREATAFDDMGVSEEVAKFFAESDDPDLDEALFAEAAAETAWDDDEETGADEDEVASDEDVEERTIEAEQDAVAPQDMDNDEADDEADAALDNLFRTEEAPAAPEPRAFLAEPASPATASTAPEMPQAAPEPEAMRPQMSGFPQRPARSDETTRAEPVAAPAEMPQQVEVPQPAVGRGASRHGRVKTRLLGFNTAMETSADPMADNDKASVAPYTSFPVGWLIVVEGAGRGSAFTLFHGVSTIGRGEDQTIRLDFGDNSISRENHASIAYDTRQQGFFIGHGGKANIVRRNDRPVLSTEELSAGDHITIGETVMRFVPFCCPEFSWEQDSAAGQAYANQA